LDGPSDDAMRGPNVVVMKARAALTCCAAAVLATGCTQWVGGLPLRAAGEPEFSPPGIVDVDRVLLDQSQIRAITGGGQDVTIIPSMDGKSPVDIEELADSVPPDCRFIFAETATFGPDIEDFRKTTFQDPPRGTLISEGAAAYRDAATARRSFDALSAAVAQCGNGSYGPLLIGEWAIETDSVHIRPGECGRDYRLKSSVLVEVTFCGLSDSVPDIVMTNIVNKIPGR
jgi:PknH-like extracellular domain